MLRDKMMQDLRLAGYALKTQKTYLECIGLFAQFCWEPGQADQDGVRAWVAQLEKSKVGLSPPVTEGPTISGITGSQGPTRWRVNGSPPFPAGYLSMRDQTTGHQQHLR